MRFQPTRLSLDEQQETGRLFHHGATHFMAAQAGQVEEATLARLFFFAVLERATLEDWPQAWWETHQLLKECEAFLAHHRSDGAE